MSYILKRTKLIRSRIGCFVFHHITFTYHYLTFHPQKHFIRRMKRNGGQQY